MTTQRELNVMLEAFFAEGTTELADRVIDAALDQIDHTHQRHALRLPRRLQTMPMFTRLAAAAVIGVLAIGGALYLMRPSPSGVGTSSPTPGVSASAPVPTTTTTPSATARVGLTGPLVVGRQIHTATDLADGRVLIAGGYDVNDDMVDSAVLYDPNTGVFSPTGSLATARGTFTATLLADGRVLITGGGPTAWNHPDPFFASAELYDPTTGTFTNTGSMATPREAHTATLLADGRVLIAGGNDANGDAVASAELYDPATGVFSATGSMTTARGYHTATRLADGRILVAGGSPGAWSYQGPMLDSAEIYDPKAGTFKATGSMADVRAWHAAALLADGRVLVTGGTSGTDDLGSAEAYDPTTGTFSPTGQMAHARIYFTATLLKDGRVLVIGGGSDFTNRRFLASAELYDPVTGAFTATASMADARTDHAANLLPDGRVLVTGGYGAVAPLASAELYDPATGTFSPAGSGG